jgi:hypothetical protein
MWKFTKPGPRVARSISFVPHANVVAWSLRAEPQDASATRLAGVYRRAPRRTGTDIARTFQEPMTSLNPLLTIGGEIGGRVPVSRVDQPAADAVHRKASALPVCGAGAALNGARLQSERRRSPTSRVDRLWAYSTPFCAGRRAGHCPKRDTTTCQPCVRKFNSRRVSLPTGWR